MTDAQLYAAVLEALREARGAEVDFYELDNAIPWDPSDDLKHTEPRRARLRGVIGRAIHAGDILRNKKGQAKYRLAPAIEQTADLFADPGGV